MDNFQLQLIVATALSVLILRFILSSFTSKNIFLREGSLFFAALSVLIGWGLAYIVAELLGLSLDFSFIYAIAIAGGESILEHALERKRLAYTHVPPFNPHHRMEKNFPTTGQAGESGSTATHLASQYNLSSIHSPEELKQYEREPFTHGLMKQKYFGERGPVKQ